MNITQKITLDLTKRSVFQYVPAKQGDKNSRVVEITLTDSGHNYAPPTGAKASFRAQKPDGTMVLNPASINRDGTVTAELTQQTLAVCGEVLCDIFLTDGTGAILSSASFVVAVEGVPSGIEIDSTSEFLKLLELIDRAENITGDFSSALDQLESIRNGAQTAAGQSAKSASEAKIAAANVHKTVTEELKKAKQSGEFTGPQGVPGDGCKITNDGAGNVVIEWQSDYLNFLQLSGGTMQGVLNMNGNGLCGLPKPTNPTDAVPKCTLDKIGVEDSENPGCYYRMVGNEKEWINPPMQFGIAYRTCERWGGKPVYTQLFHMGQAVNGSKLQLGTYRNLIRTEGDLGNRLLPYGTKDEEYWALVYGYPTLLTLHCSKSFERPEYVWRQQIWYTKE